MWVQKCQILVFWGWNFRTLLSYLKSASSNLSSCKIMSKKNALKFGTENAWFGYCWTGSWKIYCHIWNQHPRICLLGKFREKMKMPKFGTKNALFEYFWAGIWKLYCHTWNQQARVCLIAKFCEKTKTLKFRSKRPYLGIFGLGFQKTIVIFEINSLEFA